MPSGKEAYGYYNKEDKVMDGMVGKTIKHIERAWSDRNTQDIFVLIYFTDGTQYRFMPHTERFNNDFDKIILINKEK